MASCDEAGSHEEERERVRELHGDGCDVMGGIRSRLLPIIYTCVVRRVFSLRPDAMQLDAEGQIRTQPRKRDNNRFTPCGHRKSR